jgi:hypothetical protein
VPVIAGNENISFVKTDRTAEIFIFPAVREAQKNAFFAGFRPVGGDDGELFPL